MNIHYRLRSAREKQNWSQKYIAEKTGIPNSNISRYETGTRKPDVDTLITLADFLGCSVDYLLGISDEVELQNPSINYELEDLLISKLGNLFYDKKLLDQNDIRKLLTIAEIIFKTELKSKSL